MKVNDLITLVPIIMDIIIFKCSICISFKATSVSVSVHLFYLSKIYILQYVYYIQCVSYKWYYFLFYLLPFWHKLHNQLKENLKLLLFLYGYLSIDFIENGSHKAVIIMIVIIKIVINIGTHNIDMKSTISWTNKRINKRTNKHCEYVRNVEH